MELMKSALDTSFIPARVRAKIFNTNITYNPTTDVVQAAFKLPGITPTGGDWVTASWVTVGSDRFFAQALVGPGAGAAINLAAGTYKMWLKITDNPEVPVIPVDGFIKVF